MLYVLPHHTFREAQAPPFRNPAAKLASTHSTPTHVTNEALRARDPTSRPQTGRHRAGRTLHTRPAPSALHSVPAQLRTLKRRPRSAWRRTWRPRPPRPGPSRWRQCWRPPCSNPRGVRGRGPHVTRRRPRSLWIRPWRTVVSRLAVLPCPRRWPACRSRRRLCRSLS